MKTIFYLGLILMSLTSFSQGFYTDQGKLVDANGNEFIMKGINIPLTWFRNDVQGSIDDIRTNTGSNCVRIVLETNTPDNVWQNAVQLAIDNDMIPMVELHSVTGSTSSMELQNMANWWASSSRASFLKRPEIAKYVLINIANEWGRYETAVADALNPNGGERLDAFTEAVETIRNAGITTTLVIDAVGYGQDIQAAQNIRDDAQTMMDSDAVFLNGNSNLLFSIHMYCEWSIGKDDPAIVNTIKNSGIPIIVGEFGLQHDEPGGVCDIDEQNIIDQCQNAGVGWLAWSQKGNNSPLGYLDVCNDWSCSNLTSWGNTIVNGTNGTKTSITASVFLSSNQAPVVTITSPVTNSEYDEPAILSFEAVASDSDGSVSRVEFFNGTELLYTDNSAPYTYDWLGVEKGEYIITAVVTDNEGFVNTSDAVIIIVNEEQCPVPNLGGDLKLCDESITLDASVSFNSGNIFTWKKDGEIVTVSTDVLSISEAGLYEVEVQFSDCPVGKDEVMVTSGKLNVIGDEICSSGMVLLSVSGGVEPYKWFESETSNFVLNEGDIFSPIINQTTHYYIEDSLDLPVIKSLPSIGKVNQGNGVIWNIDDFSTRDKQVLITIMEEVTIDAVSVYPLNNNTDVTVRITRNDTIIDEKTVLNVNPGKRRIPLSVTLVPGEYLIDAVGTSDKLNYESQGAVFPYFYEDIISFTGAESWVISEGRYGLFYDWEMSQVTSKGTCGRTEIVASLDPDAEGCIVGVFSSYENEKYQIFPNPTSGEVSIQGDFTGEWIVYNLLGEVLLRGAGNRINIYSLPIGVYQVELEGEIYRLVKE